MRITGAQRQQRGIALLAVLLILILLSAIAAGLIYMATSETSINYNFRAEQVAYFAAKAGAEEMRDRLMLSNANVITPPSGAPSMGGGIIYLVNEGNQPGTVKPWDSGNKYFDTELCHDGYAGLSLTSVAPDVPCSSVPGGGGWYTKTTSLLPWNGTSAAVPFKWARLSMKLNNTVQKYPVNASLPAAQPVCWDGTQEIALPTTYTACTDLSNSAKQVYLITALAVTNSGARKMVQAEVAMNPGPGFPYGLVATGTGCGAVTLGGGGTTDSFSSADGGTYDSTKSNTGGDVATNGNTTANGGAQIGGNVGSPSSPALIGKCPADLTLNGGAGMVPGQTPPNQTVTNNPPLLTVPTPPAPNPLPPTGWDRNPGTLVPGTYGDVKVTGGTLTLTPGTYSLNSITMTAQSILTISPAGQVILNIAGQSINTPVDLSGGTFVNPTNLASNFQINYGGTGTVKVSGGASAYLIVDAPNAPVQLVGQADIYGAIVGNTIDAGGGAHFHYDRSLKNGLPSNGPLTMIGFRELYY